MIIGSVTGLAALAGPAALVAAVATAVGAVLLGFLGGLVLLVASTTFLGWTGIALVTLDGSPA